MIEENYRKECSRGFHDSCFFFFHIHKVIISMEEMNNGEKI